MTRGPTQSRHHQAIEAKRLDNAALQNILIALQQIRTGGRKEHAMREIRRPVHSGFETLKKCRLYGRNAKSFNMFGNATNEQLTALGMDVPSFPGVRLFDVARSR